MAMLLAGGVAAGAHPAVVAIALLAVVEPRLLIAGIIAWAVYSAVTQRSTGDAEAEATFLRALSAELRGGASLRMAIADAAARSRLGLEGVGRLARAGMPMEKIGARLRDRLSHNGVSTAAAVELSAWSGARVAAVFEGLAERATDAAELRREQRAATTQARLSAWVVGLAPLIFTVLVLAGGGLRSLERAGGAGYSVIAAGLALELLGLVVIAVILRRAR